MNILKMTFDQYAKFRLVMGSHTGESLEKVNHPENFIFNSYGLEVDGKLVLKVNRSEKLYTVFNPNGSIRLRFHLTVGNNFEADSLSGSFIEMLNFNRIPNEQRKKELENLTINTYCNAVYFEMYLMELLESRNVTITDLSDIQKVTKVNKPQPKKNKKKPSRVSKEITLNFSDIEKVVYAKPEVHVPRSYERHTESWEVRGYVRHYKSGKTVFVKPYTKGKKTGKSSEDKVYNVKIQFDPPMCS